MELSQCHDYVDDLLQVNNYKDYCPNGLQVQGKREINKIVTGVTSSLALIDAAIRASADLIIVHHGLFWRGDDYRLTSMRYTRVKRLIEHDIGLMAYHLPLDGHLTLGNNAQLAQMLGIKIQTVFDIEPQCPLGFLGELEKPVRASDFAKDIQNNLNRAPIHVHAGASQIKKIACCTGGAQKYLEKAHAQGADAYISGEISEATTHIARELGIHYFAAGHHATERYGVKALGEHLSEKFGVAHEFIDIDNPA